MKSIPALCLSIAFQACFLHLTSPVAAVLPGSTSEPVGRSGTNRLVTPVNQIVTPFGRQVDLAGLRPQAIALSSDGRLLAVSGKTSEVVLLDPATGDIRQRVALPAEN